MSTLGTAFNVPMSPRTWEDQKGPDSLHVGWGLQVDLCVLASLGTRAPGPLAKRSTLSTFCGPDCPRY